MLLLSPEGEVRRVYHPSCYYGDAGLLVASREQHWLCSDVSRSLQEVAVRSTVFKTAVDEEEEEEQEAEVMEERFFHQQV